MGPIYNIFIDINHLSDEMIIYSIHDVVYIIDLFITLKKTIIKKNPKDYFIILDIIRY